MADLLDRIADAPAIPGLLRHCSPVIYGGRRHMVDDAALDRLVGLELAREQFASVALDLTNLTGRVHAAWWAATRLETIPDHLEWAVARSLLGRAERGWRINAVQIDALARLVLRLAGRA